MPTQEIVEQFIIRVEENKHDKAIEEYYTIDASMQENESEPRVGRDLLVENERKILSRVKLMKSRCIRPVFINGDNVIIRWFFEFEWLDGTITKIEEIAYQRWQGEKILEEKFFYDPEQMVPK